jgi:polyisoprenoid-binding protein YceI
MEGSALVGTSRRWEVDGVEFAVDPALGPTIRGRFDRVSGEYEVGADGTRIELVVDPTSVDVGNGIWDGLLRPGDGGPLAGQPSVRFRSTRVSGMAGGTLHVEGLLEAAGKVEPLAFGATVSESDGGLRIEAVAPADRQWLGASADRFAFLLPATVHVTLHLSPLAAR